MTLVTLLAVNTMINGIKAEMPRVRYLQNPCLRGYLPLIRWPTSQCPTPGSTQSPTTAASASLSSSSSRCFTPPATSSDTQPNWCTHSTWSRWRRRTQPSWPSSGPGSSLPSSPLSSSLPTSSWRWCVAHNILTPNQNLQKFDAGIRIPVGPPPNWRLRDSQQDRLQRCDFEGAHTFQQLVEYSIPYETNPCQSKYYFRAVYLW